MDGNTVVDVIKKKFSVAGSPTKVPMQKRGFFTAKLTPEGVLVDNLGNQPLLPWIVFQETICVLIKNNGRAARGNAMDAKLGDEDLSFNSIEGHLAQVVYGKKAGETVFRRITPVAGILIWAGVCEPAPGELMLR